MKRSLGRGTYGDILYLKDERRNMSRAQRSPDFFTYFLFQVWCKVFAGTHLEEKQDSFVFVFRSSLTDAKRIIEDVAEIFEDGVDLA